jgi:FkbM family methyltransferase
MLGTPLEACARRLRWLLHARHRRKHPELWEFYIEEQRMPLVLQRLLKVDSCCVDVGGHIGAFLRLLKTYASKGQHVVFEASPTKSRWLKQRYSDTKIFAYAVSDKTGTAIFEEEYARPAYSGLRYGTVAHATKCVAYEVETRRLDDVALGLDRLDLIKFDIEGGELAALRGASGLIAKWKPAVIFECSSEYWLAEAKLSRLDLYNFIADDLGYEIFGFSDFLFGKGSMSYDEFRKYGLYPFRGFNFVALPRKAATPR